MKNFIAFLFSLMLKNRKKKLKKYEDSPDMKFGVVNLKLRSNMLEFFSWVYREEDISKFDCSMMIKAYWKFCIEL